MGVTRDNLLMLTGIPRRLFTRHLPRGFGAIFDAIVFVCSTLLFGRVFLLALHAALAACAAPHPVLSVALDGGVAVGTIAGADEFRGPRP